MAPASQAEERYLLLRIRTLAEKPEAATLEIEGQVDYRMFFPAATVQFDPRRLQSAAAQGNNEYGRYLSERLASCLPVQLALSNVASGRRLRFQVLLEPTPGIHNSIRWECLDFAMLPGGCLSVRSDAAFSRFTAVNRPEEEPPVDVPFHLLMIGASPDGMPPIDVGAEFQSMLEACGGLMENRSMRLTLMPGRRGFVPSGKLPRAVTLVDGHVTLQSVARALSESEHPVHGLHVLAHGTYNAQEKRFFFLLEDAATSDFASVTSTEVISQWGLERLRLVVAQSCQSAAGDNDPRLGIGGLMQQLIEAGVPGVIAMQDYIRLDAAREFTRGFYSSLLREGIADESVNAGRARLKDRADEAWSIPAFATRLSRAALWRQSPLRSAQHRLASLLQREKEDRHERDFPIDVVRASRETLVARVHEDSDDVANVQREGSPGVSALDALAQASASESTRFHAIIGLRGRGKTGLLHSELIRATEAHAEGMPGAMSPLFFRLADCAEPAYDAQTTIGRAIAKYYDTRAAVTLDPQDLQPRFEREPFLFLADGSDLAGNEVRNALAVLEDFSKQHDQPHHFVIALDESGLRLRDLPKDTECLLIQPMRAERVRTFLSSDPGPLGRRVLQIVADGALYDLAEVPWLLGEMLGQARRGVLRGCRAEIIGRVIRDGINRFRGPAGSAGRVEEALQVFAWELHQRRTPWIPEAEAFEILNRLRGNRDYPLFDFLASMIDSCNILASTGRNEVGFNYPGFRSYCCAGYLLALPDRDRRYALEEITSQLGRQSRAERWSETLFVLAGLWSDTSTLLSMILSGSLLHEGDQMFIAARCLQEARLAFDGQPGSEDPMVRSIIGALIRRASTMSLGSAHSRAKAISYLGPLREPDAVPHLISLALDKLRPDKEGKLCFDYSGVRLAAVKALLYTPEIVIDQVKAHPEWSNRPGLTETLHAWLDLDAEGLRRALDTSTESSVATVAAFALGLTGVEGAWAALRDRFLREDTDLDTLWAIADSLLEIGDPNCQEFLLAAMQRPDRAQQIAYMIGKIGLATNGTPEWTFLERGLGEGNEWALRGRCIHSLAELGDTSKLELCYEWLRNPSQKVQFYALQALRHIGDSTTLQLLEQMQLSVKFAPSRPADSLYLEGLHVEVYEDIYWRLAGGLSRETMIPIQSH